MDTRTRLDSAWKDALEFWDIFTLLSKPRELDPNGRDKHLKNEVAFLDLLTRQVVVNVDKLDSLEAGDSLTSILSHELGHHHKYPHSMSEMAALMILEKKLLPGMNQAGLVNLFYDLLINEEVGAEYSNQLAKVYSGFAKQENQSTLFLAYLAVYSKLWPGLIELSPDHKKQLETKQKGWSYLAEQFTKRFYSPELKRNNIYTRFVFFVGFFMKFFDESPPAMTYICSMPKPDADDFDSAMHGLGKEISDALRKGEQFGWVPGNGQDKQESDPLVTIKEISHTQPGSERAAFVRKLVSKHYERLVNENIFEIPGRESKRDPLIPSILEDWEYSDPYKIDWIGTVQTGSFYNPKQRDFLPDEPLKISEFPKLEIYLDTSGSMPDPGTALNSMTLAAQILAAAACRHKGSVRSVIYSSDFIASDYLQTESAAREYLLNYSGGGTNFPFGELVKSSKKDKDAVRVIISDSDFLYNLESDRSKFEEGIKNSAILIAFLAIDPNQADRFERYTKLKNFKLVIVPGYDKFAESAAALSRALFPDKG